MTKQQELMKQLIEDKKNKNKNSTTLRPSKSNGGKTNSKINPRLSKSNGGGMFS